MFNTLCAKWHLTLTINIVVDAQWADDYLISHNAGCQELSLWQCAVYRCEQSGACLCRVLTMSHFASFFYFLQYNIWFFLYIFFYQVSWMKIFTQSHVPEFFSLTAVCGRSCCGFHRKHQHCANTLVWDNKVVVLVKELFPETWEFRNNPCGKAFPEAVLKKYFST